MSKVLIIDDEPLAISILREYISSHPEYEIIGECLNGLDGYKAIQSLQPDLVFLDIQMPKINGFEMLELLDNPPAIIFTTAFDEYALRAFDANAVDYLLKPFSRDRFNKALSKYHSKSAYEVSRLNTSRLLADTPSLTSNRHISVKSGSEIRILGLDEIMCIEAYDDYVKIHIDGDVFLKKKTMQYFEDSLPPHLFIRVHRSFIIPLQKISKIEHAGKDSHVAILKNNDKIPLSKAGYSKLKDALNA